MGSHVISERTFSQLQEMASTESSTGFMMEGNYRGWKQKQHINSHDTPNIACATHPYVKKSLQIRWKQTNSCVHMLQKKLDKIQNVKQQTDPSVRPHFAHLLESPRQQHTAALAESLISIFYGDTQSQALEYLPCQITNYHINYSVTQGGGRNHLVPC